MGFRNPINGVPPSSIDGDMIAAGAIDSSHVAPDAITATHITDDAITTPKLAANAITAKHVITGALIRTAAAGRRWEMSSAVDNELLGYSGQADEIEPGKLEVGGNGTLTVAASVLENGPPQGDQPELHLSHESGDGGATWTGWAELTGGGRLILQAVSSVGSKANLTLIDGLTSVADDLDVAGNLMVGGRVGSESGTLSAGVNGYTGSIEVVRIGNLVIGSGNLNCTVGHASFFNTGISLPFGYHPSSTLFLPAAPLYASAGEYQFAVFSSGLVQCRNANTSEGFGFLGAWLTNDPQPS